MEKNPEPGSRINIPDHISESSATIFCVKRNKFFIADPDLGFGVFFPGIDGKIRI
jgi:hypothetical protein